ncbi:MAG: alpha/beta fold hydrolase [Silicimonas sp.]|nr:alpha/beta fold hydrolase [Silicimonas sp.]
MTSLVLLPGMMCDARLWGPQMGAFGRRAVLHAPLTEHDTVEALADAVLAAAPPRFALAGLSMGGIVAMEVVRRAADRVERLALLDTNPRAELPEIRVAREPQIEAVKAGGLREVMRDELKPNYLVESPEKPAILHVCMNMAMALGPEVFVRQSRALALRPDQTETLASWRGPTLILVGAEDRLCPRDRHELMHALIPGSTLVIVDDAGHLPTLEQPERTTAALIRWLEGT